MTTEISHALKCEVMGIQRSLERGIQEIQRFEEPQLVSDDAIAIIIEYVLSIYVGQCKLGDLLTISCGVTHTCMLNMVVFIFEGVVIKSEVYYEGEVDVRRITRNFDLESSFTFTFTAEKTHKLNHGRIYTPPRHFNAEHFNVDYAFDNAQITLFPHKFE